MRAVVDSNTCCGCGLCASICPDAFDMNDGKATARHKLIPVYMEENYQIGADSCPENAIRIFAQV